MGNEIGKRNLFSIDQFIILIALLGTIFAILYFEVYELIIPSIAVFIILNLAIGIWIGKTTKPAKDRTIRKYLVIQTIFLFIWCPLLLLILWSNRIDLVPAWIIILVAFYIGIGLVSFKSIFLGHKKATHKRKKKKG